MTICSLTAVARRLRDQQRGNAVVEFVLVTPLLLAVTLAILQIALALHVRATLVSAAAEGARASALSGADPQAGERRTRALLAGTVAGGVVEEIEVIRVMRQGLVVHQLRIDA
ncbi:MAG: TadE/TadG family type IV pilus assembly protein, partial [Actinomycetales bacterium]